MTITYPLAAPGLPFPRSVIPSMEFIVGGSPSIFTFEEQVQKWAGERWGIQVTLPPMTRDEAEEWIAFARQLRGRFGTFTYGVQDGYEPRGTWGGTPLVKGGGQTGYTLTIDGLPHSITNCGRKGDWFTLGTGSTTRLYKLEKDFNTNGSGEATLEFTPRLRYSPADNAALVYSQPTGQYRMESNTVAWNVEIGMEYGFNFNAMEPLP